MKNVVKSLLIAAFLVPSLVFAVPPTQGDYSRQEVKAPKDNVEIVINQPNPEIPDVGVIVIDKSSK